MPQTGQPLILTAWPALSFCKESQASGWPSRAPQVPSQQTSRAAKGPGCPRTLWLRSSGVARWRLALSSLQTDAWELADCSHRLSLPVLSLPDRSSCQGALPGNHRKRINKLPTCHGHSPARAGWTGTAAALRDHSRASVQVLMRPVWLPNSQTLSPPCQGP